MKKILFFFFLLGVAGRIVAQTTSPHVIGSAGGFYVGSNGQLSFTVAELGAVSTVSSGSNFLTQGFQQPWDFTIHVPEINPSQFSFDVFPNPSSGQMNIAINSTHDSKILIRVYDVIGKIITEKNISSAKGMMTVPLNLNHVSEGVYILELTTLDSGNIKTYFKKINIIN